MGVRDDGSGADVPAGLDIKALLSVALEQRPKSDVEDRVMTRVATVTTAMEFARLVFVAPFQWLLDDHLRGPGDGDDEDGVEDGDGVDRRGPENDEERHDDRAE